VANAEPPHDLPLVLATPPAPPAPIDPTTQRLRAIDARMKMLPAGSSARANLLAERNRLLGSADDGVAAIEPMAMPRAPADQAPDDLEVIKGIGPRIHRELEALGIVTFGQLVALSPEQIALIEEKTGFPGRVGRERWIDQARGLMAR
jgi:predicted flap endonuclease-1-like 5' DNA nuclease